jgi:glycosyltransferase involved in cell wall biosynthesis
VLQSKTLAVDARHLKSGIGTYLKCLLPEIVERSEWKWKIIGPSYWEPLVSDRVQWLPCELDIYSLKEHFLIPDLAKGADLLWVPQYNAPENWAGPLVFTLHDLIHCMKEFPRPALKRFFSKRIMKWSLEKADKVITVSEYSKERLGEFFPLSYPKVQVIHNGVQALPARPEKSPFDFPYILSFGNALSHKNFPRLIEAYLNISRSFDEHLVIAGFPGDDFENMKAMASGVEKIHLLGPQDSEAWAALLYHARLYVCPSLEEGFGLPPLEALAAGVPVASSKRASLPEILDDAAFYFDPLNVWEMSECLKEALSNDEKRQAVLTAGQKRLEEFTWKKSAEAHYKLLKKLLQN